MSSIVRHSIVQLKIYTELCNKEVNKEQDVVTTKDYAIYD